MPRVRSLSLSTQTPTTSTFLDPANGHTVTVSTDETTGDPTGVVVTTTSGDTALALINTMSTTRSWLGTVDSRSLEVQTHGGYPGMTASAVS